MKDYIKYFPVGLFLLYILKSLILGISTYELGSLAILAMFAGFYHYKDVEEYKNSIEQKHQDLLKRFDAVDSHLTQLYKNDKEMLTQLNNLKVPGQIRSLTGLAK